MVKVETVCDWQSMIYHERRLTEHRNRSTGLPDCSRLRPLASTQESYHWKLRTGFVNVSLVTSGRNLNVSLTQERATAMGTYG